MLSLQNIASAVAMAAQVETMAADTSKMVLEADEIDRAWAIKETVEALHLAERNSQAVGNSEDVPLPPPPKLSDFEYVQYALAVDAAEGMEGVLHRMRILQAFRQEYQITEEPSQGLQILEAFLKQHPGLWLAFDYVEAEQDYLTVKDWGQFLPHAQLTSPKNLQVLMAGYYYLHHAQTPHFQMMRDGDTWLIELEGCNSSNIDFEVLSKMNDEFGRWYPHRLRAMHYRNPPTLIHIFIATIKKFLQDPVLQAIRFGETIPGLEGVRLNQLYTAPDNADKVLQNLYKALLLRWKHQDQFVLPPKSNATLLEDDDMDEEFDDEVMSQQEGMYEEEIVE